MLSVTPFHHLGTAASVRAWPWQARAHMAVRKIQHFVGLLPKTAMPAVLLEQHECQMLWVLSIGNAFQKVGNGFIFRFRLDDTHAVTAFHHR